MRSMWYCYTTAMGRIDFSLWRPWMLSYPKCTLSYAYYTLRLDADPSIDSSSQAVGTSTSAKTNQDSQATCLDADVEQHFVARLEQH